MEAPRYDDVGTVDLLSTDGEYGDRECLPSPPCKRHCPQIAGEQQWKLHSLGSCGSCDRNLPRRRKTRTANARPCSVSMPSYAHVLDDLASTNFDNCQETFGAHKQVWINCHRRRNKDVSHTYREACAQRLYASPAQGHYAVKNAWMLPTTKLSPRAIRAGIGFTLSQYPPRKMSSDSCFANAITACIWEKANEIPTDVDRDHPWGSTVSCPGPLSVCLARRPHWDTSVDLARHVHCTTISPPPNYRMESHGVRFERIREHTNDHRTISADDDTFVVTLVYPLYTRVILHVFAQAVPTLTLLSPLHVGAQLRAFHCPLNWKLLASFQIPRIVCQSSAPGVQSTQPSRLRSCLTSNAANEIEALPRTDDTNAPVPPRLVEHLVHVDLTNYIDRFVCDAGNPAISLVITAAWDTQSLCAPVCSFAKVQSKRYTNRAQQKSHKRVDLASWSADAQPDALVVSSVVLYSQSPLRKTRQVVCRQRPFHFALSVHDLIAGLLRTDPNRVHFSLINAVNICNDIISQYEYDSGGCTVGRLLRLTDIWQLNADAVLWEQEQHRERPYPDLQSPHQRGPTLCCLPKFGHCGPAVTLDELWELCFALKPYVDTLVCAPGDALSPLHPESLNTLILARKKELESWSDHVPFVQLWPSAFQVANDILNQAAARATIELREEASQSYDPRTSKSEFTSSL